MAPARRSGAPCANARSASGVWRATAAAAVCSLRRTVANSNPANGSRTTMQITISLEHPGGNSIAGDDTEHDGAAPYHPRRAARRHQLSANQSYSAASWLTRFMGWLSRIERPWVCGPCIALWRVFSDLDLSEAKQTQFKSVHDCFTRELKPRCASRRSGPGLLVSPCDATDRRLRRVAHGTVLQAKGLSIPAHGSVGRRGTGALLPGRPVRDAAIDREHVSPLPRSRRLPRRAGELHLRRYLERESDRAQTSGATVSARTSGRSFAAVCRPVR